MAHALGTAPIGQSPATVSPQRLHLRGLDRRQRWQRRTARSQLGRQFPRSELLQRFGSQWPHPQLLGMLGIEIEILSAALIALRLAQRFPARSFVTRAPKSVRIHKGLHKEYRVAELRLPVAG